MVLLEFLRKKLNGSISKSNRHSGINSARRSGLELFIQVPPKSEMNHIFFIHYEIQMMNYYFRMLFIAIVILMINAITNQSYGKYSLIDVQTLQADYDMRSDSLLPGGTTYSRPLSSSLVVPDFDPTKDRVDLGMESIHVQIVIDSPDGLLFQNMFNPNLTLLLEGISLKDLQWFNFAPIADGHLQQDLSAALAYENCTGLIRPNTVYPRAYEPNLVEEVDFNLETDKVSFFYLHVRGDQGLNYAVEQTPAGVRFYSPFTGQSMTLRDIQLSQLNSNHFEWRANQLEDNLAGRMGLDFVIENFYIVQENVFNGKSVPMAGGVDQAPYHIYGYSEYTGTPVCEVEQNERIDLDLRVFLEGAYDANIGLMRNNLLELDLLPTADPWGLSPDISADAMSTTGNNAPVDWVLIEFRDPKDPLVKLLTTSGLVQRDGDIVDYDGTSPVSVDFSLREEVYIVVQHRNHLKVMSANPLTVGTSISYDFTIQNSYQSGGAGQKQLSDGVWSMFAGNGNMSNEITGQDKVFWFAENGLFNLYTMPDFNMDGDVNGADKIYWSVNNGVFSAVP